ncbi:hypothetical protein [Cupriavidus pauculus]|uniref:Uncharacterized protein n=1 Tax=Cupriavidus pauculus TaxID=82633 RepID=A0A3G8H0T2_9BURK|nr:hypothetical protein [Cupriavidus pauculus]AZG13875.1 hypothetical protein EHF44_10680 [Cupriavidus pauculus]
MTNKPTTAYSPQLSRKPGSEMLRLRVESELVSTLRTLQDRPELRIKQGRKPSKSILARRAIQVYAAHVRGLEGEDITAEVLALHRLA